MQQLNVSPVYDRKVVCTSDTCTDPNVEAVQRQLAERSKVGLLKYGVPTSEAGLTKIQWLQHLQEELMDACVYIEALKRKETPIVTGHIFPTKELVFNSETKKFEEYKTEAKTKAS